MVGRRLRQSKEPILAWQNLRIEFEGVEKSGQLGPTDIPVVAFDPHPAALRPRCEKTLGHPDLLAGRPLLLRLLREIAPPVAQPLRSHDDHIGDSETVEDKSFIQRMVGGEPIQIVVEGQHKNESVGPYRAA